jgi:hypothetical protein
MGREWKWYWRVRKEMREPRVNGEGRENKRGRDTEQGISASYT